jgi:iron complex transport system ATP-binding protein
LLKALAGILPYQNGEIIINKKSIKDFSGSEIAKTIAIVLTDSIKHGMLSVFDFVAYGRYPFTNWLGKLKQEDIRVIENSISCCKANHLKHKMLSDLSDGERQKVMIARAIAQETPIIILDEPTTHLDIKNSKTIFSLLRQLAKMQDKVILFSTHQLDLSLKIADELVIHTNTNINQLDPQEYLKDYKLRVLIEGEENLEFEGNT